ncbi:MAG: PIN domain-containing protein [Leptospiraceae bacterium]|nr:PIN domain-containing protein [Leptospiraceae bacterium]
MYLLDTNICNHVIKKKPFDVLKTLRSKSKKDVYISSITISELEYGVAKSQFPEKNKMALLLAAQAKSKKLILVTNNTKEFHRVEGLKIENWVKE